MKQPPIAEKISKITQIHNLALEDNYDWMRDKNWPDNVSDPQILKYLEQENAYATEFFNENVNLKEKIFQELKGRIKLTDQSTYIKKDNYYYYSRTEEDKDHPIYCRKFNNIEAQEEIILDANEVSEGKKFTKVESLSVSPNHKLLAYSVDFTGGEKNTIRILDLETKNYLSDEIHDVLGDLEGNGHIIWHENLPILFYTYMGIDHRPNKVFMHQLGSINDQLTFHEEDPLYNLSINKTADSRYLVIEISGHDNNEYYILDLRESLEFCPRIITPRRDKIRYNIEHHNGFLYILINDKGPNFRLARAKIDAMNAEDWQDYIYHDESKYLKSFHLTQDYLILNYIANGLAQIVVRDITTNYERTISFPDAAYTAYGKSTNFGNNDIRVDYSSLSRPFTTYTYDFNFNELSVLKSQEIPGGFNSDEYNIERIFADNNGVKVPISLFYKKSLFKGDGSNPLYLYGYGSYGIGIPASFRNTAITLADRGFVFSIAHTRGGDELGYNWYESAKFLTKKLTFEDFIVSTEYLIKQRYTSVGNIVIFGGSAGGLLVGAVINERPKLYRAAVAAVPFVDVLNTMLDESLPLTPGEFKEWGNPKDIEYFEYIRSYSPYDNIKEQDYPNMFVTAGISDYRVGYWEPAKWVAKLREMKTDNNLILFKTSMDSGHRGASGRFDYLKELAEECVFIFRMFRIE